MWASGVFLDDPSSPWLKSPGGMSGGVEEETIEKDYGLIKR